MLHYNSYSWRLPLLNYLAIYETLLQVMGSQKQGNDKSPKHTDCSAEVLNTLEGRRWKKCSDGCSWAVSSLPTMSVFTRVISLSNEQNCQQGQAKKEELWHHTDLYPIPAPSLLSHTILRSHQPPKLEFSGPESQDTSINATFLDTPMPGI